MIKILIALLILILPTNVYALQASSFTVCGNGSYGDDDRNVEDDARIDKVVDEFFVRLKQDESDNMTSSEIALRTNRLYMYIKQKCLMMREELRVFLKHDLMGISGPDRPYQTAVSLSGMLNDISVEIKAFPYIPVREELEKAFMPYASTIRAQLRVYRVDDGSRALMDMIKNLYTRAVVLQTKHRLSKSYIETSINKMMLFRKAV